MKRVLALIFAVALIAAGCSSDSDDSADSSTTTESTMPDVGAAFSTFCKSATTYVDALDKYTGALGDSGGAITVGDLKEGTDELQEARESAEKDSKALDDSIEQFNEMEAETAKKQEEETGTTSTTVVEIPVTDEAIERVIKAEEDFDTTVAGIDDSTPVNEAEVEFQSAAYALEVSWLVLLSEGGCLQEDQTAIDDIREYTIGIQTDLTTLGHFSGKVDGIYGPETVDAMQEFQASVGLPETGLPDPATVKALNEKLATETALNTSALQGMLASLGLYTGPINGVYDQATEDAVKALQAELGVPETGTMDPATWEAYINRRNGLEALLKQAESDATSTTVATTAAPTTAAPTTAAPTTTAADPTTTAAP